MPTNENPSISPATYCPWKTITSLLNPKKSVLWLKVETCIFEITSPLSTLLLCVDEIAKRFCRTGEWFVHQYFSFEPDTISLAKELTSGYIFIDGLIISHRIAKTLANFGGIFALGFTYQSQPVAAAIALTTLKLMEKKNYRNSR